MELSARNQIPGRVTEVTLGSVMAEVVIEIGGGHTLVSAITRTSAERLKLKEGDRVTAVIKRRRLVAK